MNLLKGYFEFSDGTKVEVSKGQDGLPIIKILNSTMIPFEELQDFVDAVDSCFMEDWDEI